MVVNAAQSNMMRGTYFAVDIGGTSVKWALMSDGEIGERGSIPTAFSSSDEVVHVVAELVRPHLGAIAGVGVSAPGSVHEDDADGTIHRGGALTYMDGVPLARCLREALDVPVRVNNDGRCCALGEYAAGALRGVGTGVVLAIGTGIGGGIVVDGRVLSGAHCFAGEFSFLNNNAAEPARLETVFSMTCGWRGLRDMVLEERAKAGVRGCDEVPADEVDGRMVFQWIAGGDEASMRGLRRYCLLFDAWLLNLQAIVDPDVFAIAGGISCHPELVACMNEQMDEAMSGFTGVIAGVPRPVVRTAELGNDANLYGAVYQCARSLARR